VRKNIGTILIAFFLGVFFTLAIIFLFYNDASERPVVPLGVNSVRQGGYDFINPLLECEIDSGLESKDLRPIKHKVELEISKHSKLSVENVSVYFRDLDNGPWFGINEEATFSPASLLKVPVMMGVFKEAEGFPELLNKSTKCCISRHERPDDDRVALPENFRPKYILEDEKGYTYSELIEAMILYSDNDALHQIVLSQSTEFIESVHRDLGLLYPSATTPEDFVSVKSYAALFRVLFNSSYLNRYFSEHALKLLTKVSFMEGLRKGVPDKVEIAHKYGIRALEGRFQLHDCGIIYYPGHPYLLCVMSRGNSLEELSDVIGNVSKIVFEEMNSRYGG
jgi:beta-lactamase class A